MAGSYFRSYDTLAEARAFIEGVQYVNDSALQVRSLHQIHADTVKIPEAVDRFVVHLVDADVQSDDSLEPPEGFGGERSVTLAF